MTKYKCAILALIAITLLGFHINAIAATLEATPEELKLIQYVKEKGGVVKYEVGRECPTCLRGAIAVEDISKEQLIISVPLSLGILLPRIQRRAFASEYAHGLILKFKTDPAFNKTHSLFWSTQPKPEEILSADVFPDHLIEKLQTPELERLITSQRQVAINVYYGKTRWAEYTPIPELLTDENAISLPEFLYLSSIVGTRDFALTDESVDDDVDSTPFWLLPVADMVNHADTANARRSDNGTHVLMHASRNIRKGEAVTNDYQTNVLDRNDMSLHIYGFIQEVNSERLLAVDLPNYDPDSPFNETKDDKWFHGPRGKYNTRAEVARLKALLEEAEEHTTLEEDEKLVRVGAAERVFEDWKEEMVVKFRLGRKRALKKAIATVEVELKRQKEKRAKQSAARDEL
ncbi:hypothetical protein Ndes2526B_g06746 [Nannochloris sp. 'desiccata']|nr:hypothetical protein NADE_000060 [Chlorella desiccata (nom. nud.)]